MANILWEATGLNGKIELLPDRVVVKRAPCGKRIGHRREFNVPLTDISSVIVRQSAGKAEGHIQIVVCKNSAVAAFGEESRVSFNAANLWVFEKMKLMIEQRMGFGADGPAMDMDAFEKLAALRMRGLISEAEFRARRKRLQQAS